VVSLLLLRYWFVVKMVARRAGLLWLVVMVMVVMVVDGQTALPHSTDTQQVALSATAPNAQVSFSNTIPDSTLVFGYDGVTVTVMQAIGL
jgi:hypothetical protein